MWKWLKTQYFFWLLRKWNKMYYKSPQYKALETNVADFYKDLALKKNYVKAIKIIDNAPVPTDNRKFKHL